MIHYHYHTEPWSYALNSFGLTMTVVSSDLRFEIGDLLLHVSFDSNSPDVKYQTDLFLVVDWLLHGREEFIEDEYTLILKPITGRIENHTITPDL